MSVTREGNGGRGGSGSHRRPCPETTTLRRRSGRLPECPGPEERRVPGARPSHRRDTHLRALKKQVEKKGVSRVQLCRWRAAQGRCIEWGLRCRLRAAVQALRPALCRVGQEGAHKGHRRPELRGQARQSRVQCPLSSLYGPPTAVPVQDPPGFPLLAFSPLTPN